MIPYSGLDEPNSKSLGTSRENSTSGLHRSTHSPSDSAISRFSALLRPTFLGEKWRLILSASRSFSEERRYSVVPSEDALSQILISASSGNSSRICESDKRKRSISGLELYVTAIIEIIKNTSKALLTQRDEAVSKLSFISNKRAT